MIVYSLFSIPLSHVPGVWESIGFRMLTCQEAMSFSEAGKAIDMLLMPQIRRRPLDIWQEVGKYHPLIFIRSGGGEFSVPEEWKSLYSNVLTLNVGNLIHIVTTLDITYLDENQLMRDLEEAEGTHKAERVIAEVVYNLLSKREAMSSTCPATGIIKNIS